MQFHVPKEFRSWKVLPHEPLRALGPNLWLVVGTLPDMGLKRCMVVARTEDGGLVIHNGVAVDEATRGALEALGEPAVLLVPNGWHRLDAQAYKGRYPRLRVLCPAGARKLVQKVVAVDGSYADLPPGGRVVLEHIEGIKQAEGVMVVRDEDGTTLVFNDLVFNTKRKPGLLARLLRRPAPPPGPFISPMVRMMMIKDRRGLRAHLERLAATEGLRRLIFAHGKPVEQGAAEVLRGVAGTL